MRAVFNKKHCKPAEESPKPLAPTWRKGDGSEYASAFILNWIIFDFIYIYVIFKFYIKFRNYFLHIEF